MSYMIERRYGPGNRDWFAGIRDETTLWTLDYKNSASIFSTWDGASHALDVIKKMAALWDNVRWFTFAVINDRRALPYYFASTDAEKEDA